MDVLPLEELHALARQRRKALTREVSAAVAAASIKKEVAELFESHLPGRVPIHSWRMGAVRSDLCLRLVPLPITNALDMFEALPPRPLVYVYTGLGIFPLGEWGDDEHDNHKHIDVAPFIIKTDWNGKGILSTIELCWWSVLGGEATEAQRVQVCMPLEDAWSYLRYAVTLSRGKVKDSYIKTRLTNAQTIRRAALNKTLANGYTLYWDSRTDLQGLLNFMREDWYDHR